MKKIIYSNTSILNCTPLRMVLDRIVIQELSGNPVVVNIGTSGGGTDIAENLSIGPNEKQTIGISSLSDPTLSLYFTSSAWNGSRLKVSIINIKQ